MNSRLEATKVVTMYISKLIKSAIDYRNEAMPTTVSIVDTYELMMANGEFCCIEQLEPRITEVMMKEIGAYIAKVDVRN